MANFDRLAELGKPIFLGYDQQAMIRRFGLRADSGFLYLRFCGMDCRVDRQTADVFADGLPAGPAASLSIYDMLCRDDDPPPLLGRFRTTNSLPGIAQSNPDDVVLNASAVTRFEQEPDKLRAACRAMGGRPFPVGDIAWELPVFDWFPAVLQFWQGDEEFPSSLRFLWDEHALQFVHYETLYYIMACLLRQLGR